MKLYLFENKEGIAVTDRPGSNCWLLYYGKETDLWNGICPADHQCRNCPFTMHDAVEALEMFYTLILGRTHGPAA